MGPITRLQACDRAAAAKGKATNRRGAWLRRLLGTVVIAFAGCSPPNAPIHIEPLTFPNLVDLWPEWSPAGDSIAYYRIVPSADGPPGLYLIHRNGGLPRLISAQFLGRVSFSPNGRRIVGTDGDRLQILDLDAGTISSVGYTDNGILEPCWSPDGRRIVYSRVFLEPGEAPDSAGIYIYDLELGTHVPLHHDGVPTYGGSPRWSPDGTTIAFWFASSVYSIRSDGTELRMISQALPDRIFEYPRWLSDSRHLIFFQVAPPPSLLYEVDLATSEIMRKRFNFGLSSSLSPSCTEVVRNEIDPLESGKPYVLFIRDTNTGALVRQLTRFAPPAPSLSRIARAWSRWFGAGVEFEMNLLDENSGVRGEASAIPVTDASQRAPDARGTRGASRHERELMTLRPKRPAGL